jgi:PAS domain S-box-containing protein
MNILVAHPTDSYVEALKQMLSAQGENYNLEGITSLVECIARISHYEFDVAIIDSSFMQGESKSFLEKLHLIEKHVPVILLIDERHEYLIHAASELNVTAYIDKRRGFVSSLPGLIDRIYEIRKERMREEEVGKLDEMNLEIHKIARSTNMTEGYFICDRRGRFLSANEVIQSLSGYSEEELMELAITDLMTKEDEERFFERVFQANAKETSLTQSLPLIDKMGEKHPVELRIRILREEGKASNIIGFRGSFTVVPLERPELPVQKTSIDQNNMIAEVVDIVHLGYTEPLSVILKRIAELVCQTFGFKRSTVALLDRRKKAFIKQAMVGYSTSDLGSIERRAIEVPQEVIDRIFADRFKIKVIYYTQDQRDSREFISPGMPERRTQRRRPESQWHKRDLILLNLADHLDNTFGYISLDEPDEGNVPSRTTFHNMEIFGKLASMAIENYYRFSMHERRYRRLKQVLVSSNIFKLYLSLSELLKEVVWSVKFSLDFNLVALVLISKKSGLLETKAVACDDKIKLLQIRELNYDLKDFSSLLRDDYRQGRSYFIKKEEAIIKHFKRIYYGSDTNGQYDRFENIWPRWALILVPIKSREGKIIGFIMADDPRDCHIPSNDTINILEILANQIAIAIDNRVMYVQAKEQIKPEPQPQEAEEKQDDYYSSSSEEEDYTGGGLKKLVERFLR